MFDSDVEIYNKSKHSIQRPKTGGKYQGWWKVVNDHLSSYLLIYELHAKENNVSRRIIERTSVETRRSTVQIGSSDNEGERSCNGRMREGDRHGCTIGE